MSNFIQEAENLSEANRKRLELDNAPIKDIFNILEGQGILVVRMPIDDNNLSGAFYFDKNKNQASILINTNRSKGHQNFTASHEYGHFLLDKEDQPIIIELNKNEKPIFEKRADCFAANFLMPAKGVEYFIKEILKVKNKKLSDSNLAKIKIEFGVSWLALLYRLNGLKYSFDKQLKEKLGSIPILNFQLLSFGHEMELSEKNGELKLPSEYYKLAFSAYFEEKITLERLAELLRISYEEVREQIVKFGRDREDGSKG